MKKTAKITIVASAEALAVNMSEETLTISQEYDIQTLVALGAKMQEDICDELIEQLDAQYESNTNLLALTDVHISCYVADGKKEDEDLYLEQDSISPRLRGLYERISSNGTNSSLNSIVQNFQQSLQQPQPVKTIEEQYASQFINSDPVTITQLVQSHLSGSTLPHNLTVSINKVSDYQDIEESGYYGLLIEIEPTSIRITDVDGDPYLDNGNVLFSLTSYEETNPAEFNKLLDYFNNSQQGVTIRYGRVY